MDGTRPGPSQLRIVVAGASARAAALSLRRARFSPIAIDLFNDFDTRQICETHPLGPAGLASLPTRVQELGLRGLPWCYAGGLENLPDVVSAVSEHLPLLGNAADVLHRVRDPFAIQRLLADSGLPALNVVLPHAGRLPASGGTRRWLLKPLRSAGGRGIRLGQVPRNVSRMARTHYLQEYRRGTPVSASFLAGPLDRDTVVLLGIARQFVGLSRGATQRFHYCGSATPVALSAGCQQTVLRIGQTLASSLGLRGVFGIDLIVNGETPWLVEVNPRWTASMELWDLLRENGSSSIMGWHVARSLRGDCAVGAALRRRWAQAPPAGSVTAGTEVVFDEAVDVTTAAARPAIKLIAFSRHDLLVTEKLHRQLVSRQDAVGDIPMPGVRIGAGDPLCTLLVRSPEVPTLVDEAIRFWDWLARLSGGLSWSTRQLAAALETGFVSPRSG